MFRRITMLVLCVLLAMSFAGCAEEAPETTLSQTCPRSVMINGEIWQDWDIDAGDIMIGESDYLGRIVHGIKTTAMPQRDNETNYVKAMNAPYARWTDKTYGEVYVIYYSNSWHILLPEGYWTN